MGGLSAFSQLLGPASATGPGFLTTSAQTIGFVGPKTWQATAQAGTAEIIFTFTISDDTSSYLRVQNGTTSNTVFIPMMEGQCSSALNSLVLQARASSDSGSNAAMMFNSKLNTASSLATRPAFDWQNNSTSQMQISAAGSLSISGGTAPGLTIGASGTKITQTRVYSQSLTPSSVAANTTAEQTFTVSGLTTADKVAPPNGPAPTAGTGIVAVRVSAADTLAITFSNNTAGSLTPASGTYNIVATRS